MSTSLDLTGLAGDPASPVHRLDPRAKLVLLVGVTVVAVSASLATWPVWAACGSVLVVYGAVGRVPVRELWRRGRFVLPPVLFVAAFLPFVRDNGGAVLATVAAKATIGTLSAVLLACTTTVPSVLRGLEALRVPRLLVLIAAFMYRYLFVIVEEVARMRAGLAARGYHPRHALQAGPLGRVATATFLRTYARGERVHLAMLARGYDGTMPHATPLVLRGVEIALVAACVGALVAVRVVA